MSLIAFLEEDTYHSSVPFSLRGCCGYLGLFWCGLEDFGFNPVPGPTRGCL